MRARDPPSPQLPSFAGLEGGVRWAICEQLDLNKNEVSNQGLRSKIEQFGCTSSKFWIRVLVGLFGFMLYSSGKVGGCEWSVGCAKSSHRGALSFGPMSERGY